jgi:CRISPR/Cas system type I-B associated protein Csh2 (Cas7 group RAMP superfamily)
MRAYFKTLKYTTAEVESITRALDKMGNKFKKINKYAVGSIIANVATQAGLKAEEAEAMVEPAALVYDTFMRGGRTPQQAQLAIKEIAEGEFVRLSRETGVVRRTL